MAENLGFSPDYAIPPGATLKETLETKGISQAELSLRTGLAEKTISQIINGIAPITFDTSAKLELALGVPARFWNKRELSYREALARIEEAAALEDSVQWLKELPVKHLLEHGFVDADDDRGASLVRNMLKFFGVSSVEAWQATWLRSEVLYRSQGMHEKKPGYVAAWIRIGELVAEKIECAPYDARAFREALRYIRTLTVKSASIWQAEVVRACAEAGVAVAFVKEISGASVSGATKWLTKDKALIAISLKYKSDDQFWFTFFHEAAHILLHGKREIFIDDGQREGQEEREADRFSRDVLIPPTSLHELALLKSKAKIRAFAARIGISPGVVVGRLQKDRILPPSFCNDLKRRFQWQENEPEQTDSDAQTNS